METNKCHGCIFEDIYRDMGASVPVCNRCAWLEDALKAHSDPSPCKWYITITDIIELQEEKCKSENNDLPHTRIDPVLNSYIKEVLDEFHGLIVKAKTFGLDIKLTPNSTSSLELYFHDDYPDTILVDKEELGM